MLVDKYRGEPTRKLGLAEALRHADGDQEAVLQVWSLLNRWGIINYQPEDTAAAPDTSRDPTSTGEERPFIPSFSFPELSCLLLFAYLVHSFLLCLSSFILIVMPCWTSISPPCFPFFMTLGKT